MDYLETCRIIDEVFAFYMAKELGCNVDQPRNLAKSVTTR